jgi:hypothetical protein
MDLNVSEFIDPHRFDSMVTFRRGFGHCDDNIRKPARWRTRPDTAAQKMPIEQRYKGAVLDAVEIRIALAALAVSVPASNRFKRLPGGFDQPPLRVGRKVDVGHDRTA